RLMTRSDIVLHLEARLRIQEEYRKHPEIDDQVIDAPTMIVGSGRCGTSAMMTLISQDRDIAVLRSWEALFPAPAPERATYYTDPRIERADKLMTQWNRVTPEIEGMHEFDGTSPTELIHAEAIGFQSVAWLYLYGFVPSYIGYMATRSSEPAMREAKRVLKLLQWKNPRSRWILKSPDAMRYMPDVFKVFPDMRLVWMHRDPIKAVSSMTNLIGTLFWIRSDQRLHPNTFEQITNPAGLANMFNQVIDWLEQGVIPPGRMLNILYADFIKDPVASAANIYAHAGIEMSADGRAALEKYTREHPREKRVTHAYSTGDEARRAEERALFARYQSFFNVPTEA
ncbi:MAG: sulfotransferase, partial [Caulobacterales bacterium]